MNVSREVFSFMGNNIKIYGLQKMSMVDYPGKIAATVFTGGCNLCCPFCHNALLVTRLKESHQIDTDEVHEFLGKRKGLLDGVVVSGGEPLLWDGTASFIQDVKNMGFLVKLDTNGCYPDKLSAIIEKNLVDYVAMDIKNSPEKYAVTTGLKNFDIKPVEESIEILKQGSVEFEFRTTVVKELHNAEDILKIGEWLKGAPKYYLQNFEDSGNLISDGYHGFSQEEMKSMEESVESCFGQVGIRGY